MNVITRNKNIFLRFFELTVCFGVIPAVLSVMLLHLGDDGSIYFIVHGQKLMLSASVSDYLRQFPGNDISYQLKFSFDYFRYGAIDSWVLSLWPPGMPGVYWLILKISGPENFPLKIIVLAIGSYAVATYSIYRGIAQRNFSPTILIACALPLFFGTFSKSIFLGNNLFSSDFYCFVLLAILLSKIFRLNYENTIRHILIIAILLAALAYFRSYYYIFIKLFSIGWIGGLIVWGLILIRKLKRGRVVVRELFGNRPAAIVGKVLLVTWIFLLPWKMVLNHEGKTFDWTSTDQVWAAQWRNDLPPFLVGMNTPCIIDRELCEQLMPFQYSDTWATPKLGAQFYKILSISTFLLHPYKWYREKAKGFYVFWFDGQQIGVNNKLSLSESFFFLQSACLLFICMGLVLLAIIRVVRKFMNCEPLFGEDGLDLIFLIFFIFNVMLFTFVHFESRYSIPLKWFTYLFFIFKMKNFLYKIDTYSLGRYTSRGVQ